MEFGMESGTKICRKSCRKQSGVREYQRQRCVRLVALLLAIFAGALCGILFGEELPVFAAQTIKQPYLAEQAIGKAPRIRVFLTGSKVGRDAAVSGTMGAQELEQDGELERFSDSGEGISYIILLDNSGSVDRAQFQEAKQQLASLCRKLRGKDRLTVYTVGTTSPRGEKTVVCKAVNGGDGAAKKKAAKKIEDISYMQMAESKTVLYRSLNQVLAGQSAQQRRTIVLLVTDGEDDSEGKDISDDSTLREVKASIIPVYGVLLHNSSSVPNRKKIDYTQNKILNEKNCRGYYADCSGSSSPAEVQEAFQTLDDLLKKQTYVAHLAAGTNRTEGKGKLALVVDGNGIDPVPMDYSDFEEDKEPPVVQGDVSQNGANAIVLHLSDENGVDEASAGEAVHYALRSKAKNGDGKVWSISEVQTKRNGKELAVTLALTEDLYTESYILEINGIRDESQSSNEMQGTSVEFTVEDGKNPVTARLVAFLISFWWIFLLLIVLVIGLVLLLVVRNKKAKAAEIDAAELTRAKTRRIRLKVFEARGTERSLDLEVDGSFFVGRSSSSCELFFDDDQLSKQHFVIEANRMGCYVTDLESTNGTKVNGVRITERRQLADGDEIVAGRERIIFYMEPDRNGDRV